MESITRRAWVKIHAMIGTTTNVVTAVDVTTNNSADAPFLPQLLTETAKRFQIGDLCADKAYLSEFKSLLDFRRWSRRDDSVQNKFFRHPSRRVE